MARNANKQKIYIVQPTQNDPSHQPYRARLVRGTLKEVESKLRGELDVRPATPEECHQMHDVEIEDASGEPV